MEIQEVNLQTWPKLTIDFGRSQFEEGSRIEVRLKVQNIWGEREMTLNFADCDLELEQLEYRKILELAEDGLREIFRDSNRISRFE